MLSHCGLYIHYDCMLLYSHNCGNLLSRAAYFHHNVGDSKLAQDNTTGDILM